MLCAVQGFVYIKNDTDMVDLETGTASMARNTNLNEDLGKVEYVFSDKTGTLTANEMQLRELAIKGVAYGDASFKCASVADFAINCHTAMELVNF
jgi:phospholipid-transporting ATPase